MMKKLALGLCLGVLLLLCFERWLVFQAQQPLGVEQATELKIKRGETTSTLLRQLQQTGHISPLVPYRLLPKRFPHWRHIKAGTYALAPEDNLMSLMQRLVAGEQKWFKLTLTEGHTVRQYLEVLSAHPNLNQKGLASSPSELAELLKLPSNPEGLFFPDTYVFHDNTPAIEILRQANRRMEEELKAVWARNRNPELASEYALLVLASIIEKETGRLDEQGVIAAVFTNRLRKKMRLQTDPTVIYGMGEGFDGNIRKKDLKQKTPYNTYVIKGLPPTPIASPGVSAMLAAAQPAQSDFYYFVAKGDGSHYFSRTYKEHRQAVVKYQLKSRH